MVEAFMTMLLAVTVFGGYLFPLPSVVMASREWLSLRRKAPQSEWRRAATTTALLLFCLAMPLWLYAVVRELRGDYSYVYFSAQVGRWSSLALFLLSCFTEARYRRYSLVGSAGLYFFYAFSMGELP